MQIGCTKKLLDYIGERPRAVPISQVDPLFTWTANIMTIHHRRAIVVCNDATQYSFALYGVKKTTLKNLNELLIQGLHACFDAECIAPEIKERYLADCSEEVAFTRTLNRSLVARINQAVTRFSYFEEDLTTDHVLQDQLLLRMNRTLGVGNSGVTKDFVATYIDEDFASRLSQHYGAHPYLCTAAEFDVTLELDTPCSRRVIVPLRYTFEQFHYVIQSLFNWKGYHLHDFIIEYYIDGSPKYTLVGTPREDELPGETTQPDASVCLSEIFPKYDHITYNYDFGDDWIHQVRFVRLIDRYDNKHPVCLSGEGEAPPEDVGGPYGYAEMLSILADPSDPEHDQVCAWYSSMRCLPFDIERINRMLKHSIRWFSSLW